MSDLLDSGRPVARKRHVCAWGCGRPIEIGEQYTKAFVVDGGTGWTWREHHECRRFMVAYYADDRWAWDDGLGPGDFAEAASEDPALAAKYGIEPAP